MFKKGQQVVTVDHIVYQHLSHGAVITPPKEHKVRGGKIGTVSDILDSGAVEIEFLSEKWQDYSYLEMSPDWIKPLANPELDVQ